MSVRSQHVRSHPCVRGLGLDLFGNQRGMEINESAENSVILLSKPSYVGFRILNHFRRFDIGLKGCPVNLI